MKRALHCMTVAQARAVQSFSPGRWLLAETPEGWIARRGDSVLYGSNTGRVRTFKSVDSAVRRLRAELGATEFVLEALGLEQRHQPKEAVSA